MTQVFFVGFFFVLFVMAMLLVVWKDYFSVDRKATHFTQVVPSDIGNHFAAQFLEAELVPESRMRQVVSTELVCQMGILTCGAVTEHD